MPHRLSLAQLMKPSQVCLDIILGLCSLIIGMLTTTENNLALQESLYALRSETKEAFDEAKRLEIRWAELEKEQKEVYQRLSPQFLLMRLRHATSAQDDKSEEVASAFIQSTPGIQQTVLLPPSGTGTPVQGGKDIDDFIREFKELRKVYHKRVIWGEKWVEGQVEWRDD
jgi:ESCRT-I complex subunit VPS37